MLCWALVVLIVNWTDRNRARRCQDEFSRFRSALSRVAWRLGATRSVQERLPPPTVHRKALGTMTAPGRLS